MERLKSHNDADHGKVEGDASQRSMALFDHLGRSVNLDEGMTDLRPDIRVSSRRTKTRSEKLALPT